VPDGVITLWRYRDLPEALLAHNKLQAHGFECCLADDEVVRLNWFWSNLLGGVRLCLRENDADAALAVLAEQIPISFSADEVGEGYVQPVCPQCESRDSGYEEVHWGLALFVLWVFALPVPRPVNRWRCEDCGHTWKGEYV
jgi:hypothetical protein